jgi:hypothetical protein
MKVYISGMITGLKHDQYRKKFKEAAEFLSGLGYDTIDPSDLGKPEHHAWVYYMRKAIPQLCECDTIYMLEGWAKSKGASLEHTIASSLGFNIMYEGDNHGMENQSS